MAGTVSAIAALLLTLAVGYWIFSAVPEPEDDSPHQARLRALAERKQAAYDNLKDLHFEHLAGKLSEADYQASRRLLENEAAQAVKALENEQARGEAAPSSS